MQQLENRRLLTADPIVNLDFGSDQSLTQLQADGWQVDAAILDDQDGIDDLRVVGGALELTDDLGGSTGQRFAHEASYDFTSLQHGSLRVAAGTSGSYTGNPGQRIHLQASGIDIATIQLRNDSEGLLISGGGSLPFGDTSWRDEFRYFEIQWDVEPDGTGGVVSLRFEASDGTLTQVINQPFLANGIPNGIGIKAGWSVPVDTTLRIDFLIVTPEVASTAVEISPSHYHDVAVGSAAGEVVAGRVHLAGNVVSGDPSFAIVGGSGSSLFDVTTQADGDQRRYGEITVAAGASLTSLGSYTLDLRTDNCGELSAIQTVTIQVVDQTAASLVYDAMLGTTRYRTADIDDATVADWMSKIGADGSFSDLSGYHWTESANRLGSLAETYAFNSTYQGDAALRGKLYSGVVYWSENGPGDDGFVDPAWGWPRQIGAVGYFLFDDLKTEMKSADSVIADRAWRVHQAVLLGTETALTNRRNSEEHFWGGNLGYRLHPLQLRAVLLNDYNEPLIDLDGFQRGFEPVASFADIQSLIGKSFDRSTGPFSVGLTNDGGFSQHVSGGAQLLNFGYGRDWAADVTAAGNRLQGTPWSLSNTEYDQLADYILDGIQWQVFNGQGDYLAMGRRAGNTTTSAYSNADVLVYRLLRDLIVAAGDSQLTRHDELVAARDAWDSGSLDLEGHRGLWNHDFALQRTAEYYVSTKLNSVRSSGNETGNNENLKHYHMGDGTTLVMLTGDEYVNARVGWDWHQLPGTTAEARTDVLPTRRWNNGNAGLNDFAGVVSDGNLGIAAFINDRYDSGNSGYQYHTVNSNKGTFFFGGTVFALGADIKRVGPGQNQPIRTTLNQTEWRTDVSYDVGSGIQTLPIGSFNTQSFNITSPAWFHQDGIGYVLLPPTGESLTANLETRSTNNDWYDLRHNNGHQTQQVDLFQLAIDHGTNPTADKYQYVIVPNQSAAEMPGVVAGLAMEVIENTDSVQAVRDTTNDVTQVVFYEAGAVTLASGMTLTSNRPALVMLSQPIASQPGGELEITVADPLHSTTESETILTLTEPLSGAGATWDPLSGHSTLVFGHSNDITLAGQPVTRSFASLDPSLGLDFGDAPDSYPTTLAEDGARHVATGPQLGPTRDSETDGVHSSFADADGSDEDGVMFGGIGVNESMAAVNILLENASSAKVDAWIDFNRDGDWDDAGENILNDVLVRSVMSTLNYNLPAELTAGDNYARVRLSSAGGLDPTGLADDGEVEDYVVNIVSPPQVESVVVNQGDAQRSGINTVRVTFDDVVDIDWSTGDVFEFFNSDTNQVAVDDHDNAVVNHTSGKTVVDVTFLPGSIVNAGGGLIDGDYHLRIDSTRVTMQSVELDGDQNGSTGGDYVFGASAADNFYRKYGDYDANGIVGLSDFASFRQVFGETEGQPGYLEGMDADSDGSIGLSDFAEFRQNFGT